MRVVRFSISLFLAVQVWYWSYLFLSLSMGGELNIDILGEVVTSFGPFRFAVESFLIAYLPAAALFFTLNGKLSGRYELLIYAAAGAVLGNLFILYTSGMPLISFKFVLSHLGRSSISGILGGGAFYALLYFPLWNDQRRAVSTAGINESRRTVLSSIVTAVSSAGLISSLVGPARVWKNRNKYLDVNLSDITGDQPITVEVDNRPVWIIRRSESLIKKLSNKNFSLLDPESIHSNQPDAMRNIYRSLKPEYLVVYAVCTHLGCIPVYQREESNNTASVNDLTKPQLFCPCHGGMFDLAGRVYKGTPAPVNLEIPNYEFLADNIIRIYYPGLREKW